MNMKLRERIQSVLRKRSIHEVSFVYAGALVNGLSLFALNIALARALSPVMFGAFALSVLVLSTVAEISDFGLNAGLLRFAPYYISTAQTDKLKQLVKTIWRWRVTLTLVLTGGGIIFAYPIAVYVLGQPEITSYIAYASLGIGGVILLGFLATYLQASQRFGYNATLQSLKGLLRLAVVVIMMAAGVTNLFAYLSAYIFVPWILFLLSYQVLPDKFRESVIDAEVKNKLHAQLARFSFWLTISSLLSILASRVDQIMVSRLLGLEQVAIYAVAYQLIQFFPLIYNSISSVLTPKINSLTDKAALVIFIKRTLKWMVALALGLAVCIYPSQYVIHFLFGQKYDAAMAVYLVLAYSLLFNILVTPFSLAITVFNRTHLVAFSGVIQLVINVVGNLLLIPQFGVIGAAYTFGLGILVGLLYNVGCAWYLIRYKKLEVV